MKLAQHVVFPPFRLDPANEQLWRDTQLVPLPPKTFAVLRYLVEHAGRLVTKEELLKAVWPDTRVSEGVLKGYIRDLREALGDNSEAPRFIATMPRRGHRFVAPLTTITLSIQGQSAETRDRGLELGSLSLQASSLQSPASSIVGRKAELAQLQRSLDKALQGERQIMFVTGEPGIGKTTVVEAFLSGGGVSSLKPQASDLWIGRGQCVEHYGTGEAYLPVLEALGRVGRAPDGERLVALLNQYAPTWLVQMPALLGPTDLETLQRKVAGATRERMLREMVEAIEALTTERALVLWLEDLHWADYSTLDWLAAIAQQRGPARLLVIGTYRPADVSISGHPLKAVKQELQARRQCEELWLQFLTPDEVGLYLDARYPRHQFPPELGRAVHRNTDGNPLFIINMVDYLVAQGVIAEVDGCWRLRTAVEEVSHGVPESLRQLIEKHIERLSEEQQRLLEVASVAGREFSAAAVAAGLETTIEQVEEACEGLVRRGQFLQAHGPGVLPDGALAGRYGFLHTLYQGVLYERLPAIRRMRLHRRVGESEERLYGSRAGEIAAELAVHFERGQDAQRAVKYLQQAAENVLHRYAHREAIGYQQRALALLQTLPDTPERARQELILQVARGVSLSVTEGFGVPEVERAYARARELCQRIGNLPTLVPILYGLWNFYLVRTEFQPTRELAAQMLSLAEREQAPAFLLAAHNAQTQTLFEQGDLAAAHRHMAQVLALYDPRQHHAFAEAYGEDLGVSCLVFAIWILWHLGYPDQALGHAQTVKKIAAEVSHPLSLAQALCFGATLQEHFQNRESVQEMAKELIPLCREHDLALWLAGGMALHGWTLVERGEKEAGIAELRQGISDWQATGAEVWMPYFRSLLAKAYGKTGQLEDGLQVVTEALTVTSANGEEWFDAELYRLKGELTLQQLQVSGSKFQVAGPRPLTPDPYAEVEACFQQALDIARRQSAKSLELRAAMSLGRLWQSQGKSEEAHALLATIYDWFTEGFATKDLQDAKALLDELGGEAGREQRENAPAPKARIRPSPRGVTTKKKKS